MCRGLVAGVHCDLSGCCGCWLCFCFRWGFVRVWAVGVGSVRCGRWVDVLMSLFI